MEEPVNLTLVDEVVRVNVPAAVVLAPRMTLGLVSGSEPELLMTVRLLKDEEPVINPERVCWEVPAKRTVPELWVKVAPLLV